MTCKFRGSSYRGCDGQMYFRCAAMDKDIPCDECGCVTSSPKDYCGFFEEKEEK